MLNLLPQEAQRVLNRVYRAKLAILWLIVLFVSFSFSVISLLPALISYKSDQKALEEEIEFLKIALERSKSDSNGIAVGEAGQIFEAALFDRVEQDFGVLLRGILKYNSPSVDISSIKYVQNDGNFVIDIDGVAERRDDLVFLINALKRDDMFENATVPITQFAKDRDISFNMEVHGLSVAVSEDEN